MYEEYGEAILYKVEEVTVEGYTATYVDDKIINTIIPIDPIVEKENLPATDEEGGLWLLGIGILLVGES